MARAKDMKRNSGRVELDIGGRVRELRYDLNAYAELENHYGTVEAAMIDLQKGGMKAVRLVLWVGLIHDEAVIDEVTGEALKYNITPYEVGGWIGVDKFQEITEKIKLAMETSLPDPKEKEEKEDDDAPKFDAAGNQIATVILTPEEKAEKEKNV